MKENKGTGSKTERGERNRDEGRDDNWASFASVSVCFTDFLCLNLGQGYLGCLTAPNYTALKVLH